MSGPYTFQAFQCKALLSVLPEPADCNWPVCGCDPYADKVIGAIEESGAAVAPQVGESKTADRSLLLKLLMLLDPPPMEGSDGKTYVFKNPMAADILTRISAVVREYSAAPFSLDEAHAVAWNIVSLIDGQPIATVYTKPEAEKYRPYQIVPLYALHSFPSYPSDSGKEVEIARLNAIINQPMNNDFLRGVSIEAEHQRQKWGEPHDRSKSAENWFWLVGYLVGKCLRACITGDKDKAQHHTISSAAALFNWHEAISRDETKSGIGADIDIKPRSDGGHEGENAMQGEKA